MQREKPPEWWEKQKGSRGIRRGQWYRLVFQFPIRQAAAARLPTRVANQRMTGSNARWKWTTDYNRRSIAETAMYRVKQLFGGALTLRDYDGQVAEAMALVRALNKMTKAGIPESVRIA